MNSLCKKIHIYFWFLFKSLLFILVSTYKLAGSQFSLLTSVYHISNFSNAFFKASIPLRRKTTGVGANLNFVGDTNMLVSKNAKIRLTPNAKHKTCVTPNAKPQRKEIEYKLLWVPNAKFSHWPCTFNLFWCRFYSLWVPFFSGIWA